MTAFRNAFRFISEHRIFMLFFIATLCLNVWLFINENSSATDYISCSSFDRGPLGTYGFFEHLSKGGFPVQRVKLPLYRELDPVHDKGKTLFILSPRTAPGPWEWDKIISWVSAGNRLVTCGFYGPSKTLFQKRDFNITTTRSKLTYARICLPVDSSLQNGALLSPETTISYQLFMNKLYKESDSSFMDFITNLAPDMMPFITIEKNVLSVKKMTGSGEWIIFTPANIFSNTLLRDKSWYNFAIYFVADSRFTNKLLFDEYHNGYRATQSFWQLLEYYRFDKGIIFLSLIALLFLFQQGVRILPPRPAPLPVVKSSSISFSAMSSLLFRYKAWNGLLARDLQGIKEFLSEGKNTEIISPENLVDLYLAKGGTYPDGIDSKEDLKQVFGEIVNRKLNKKTALKMFNNLVHIRKDLKL